MLSIQPHSFLWFLSFFYIQAAPAQVPDQFPVNTAPVTDPVLLQIRFLRAGHDLHTMIFCSMSQLFGKFTQAFVLKSFTAQLFQVLFLSLDNSPEN